MNEQPAPRTGVRPAKQERSQKRQREILKAAHRLLEQVGYESMKMEDIAAAANSSVGSLYQRFKKKEGLLDAMLEEVSMQLSELIRLELDEGRLSTSDHRAVLLVLVSIVVDFMRENQAFIRAITHRQLRDPAAVSPLQQTARAAVGRTWAHLSEHFPLCRRDGAQARFAYGMQIVIGVATNAVLNRPGPVRIDDTAMTDLLVDTVDGLLASDLTPPSPQ